MSFIPESGKKGENCPKGLYHRGLTTYGALSLRLMSKEGGRGVEGLWHIIFAFNPLLEWGEKHRMSPATKTHCGLQLWVEQGLY